MTSPGHDLDELCWRYLDGLADAAEVAALDGYLRRDPTVAARLVAHQRLHQHLASSPVLSRAPTATHRRVRPRPAPPARSGWILAAGVLLLVALGVVWSVPRAEGGPWEVIVQNGRTAPVARDVGLALPAGSVVRHRQQATRLTVTADARLRLGAHDWQLDHGALRCDIAPQPAGERFAVRTPHAEVVVLGTSFTVEVAADATHLAVQHGRVRFTPHGGTAREVAAGERATTAPPRIDLLLLDADRGEPLPGTGPLGDEVRVVLGSLPTRRLNIEARVAAPVLRVELTLDGRLLSPEHRPPWTLAGNDPLTGRFNAWTPTVGRHRLQVQAIAADGTRLGQRAVTLTVVER